MKKAAIHLHSTASDGLLSRYELCSAAQRLGADIVGISDHNVIPGKEEFELLRAEFPGLELPLCSEISCSWQGEEIHILALDCGFDYGLEEFLQDNIISPHVKEAYINALIRKLHELGIPFQGSYSTLQADYPSLHGIGRSQLAQELVRRKLAPSASFVFDNWIGDRGKRLAYIPKPLTNYHSLEDTVSAVLACHASPVLCHPFSIPNASIHKVRSLVSDFQKAGGHALELNSREQKHHRSIQALAEEFGLLLSRGADFHSWTDSSFDVFPADFYFRLKQKK